MQHVIDEAGVLLATAKEEVSVGMTWANLSPKRSGRQR
jgi:hypothetical protein